MEDDLALNAVHFVWGRIVSITGKTKQSKNVQAITINEDRNSEIGGSIEKCCLRNKTTNRWHARLETLSVWQETSKRAFLSCK